MEAQQPTSRSGGYTAQKPSCGWVVEGCATVWHSVVYILLNPFIIKACSDYLLGQFETALKLGLKLYWGLDLRFEQCCEYTYYQSIVSLVKVYEWYIVSSLQLSVPPGSLNSLTSHHDRITIILFTPVLQYSSLFALKTSLNSHSGIFHDFHFVLL